MEYRCIVYICMFVYVCLLYLPLLAHRCVSWCITLTCRKVEYSVKLLVGMCIGSLHMHVYVQDRDPLVKNIAP